MFMIWVIGFFLTIMYACARLGVIWESITEYPATAFDNVFTHLVMWGGMALVWPLTVPGYICFSLMKKKSK